MRTVARRLPPDDVCGAASRAAGRQRAPAVDAGGGLGHRATGGQPQQPVGAAGARPPDAAAPTGAAGRGCSGCAAGAARASGLVQHLGLVRRHVHAGRAVAGEQPLQARQRSSASRTAGSAKPGDAASRRAPPGAPGPGRGWSPSRRGWRGTTGTSRRWPGAATHLPTPVQRCTASPERAAVVGQPQGAARGSCRGRPGRRSASSGAGSTRTPGLSSPSGSQQRLDRGEQAQRLLVVHQRQQLRAGPAVAVLAGERAAVAAQRGRRGGEEVAEAAPPGGRRRGSRCGRARSRRRSGRRARSRGRARRAARRSRAARRRGARAGRRRPPSRSTPGGPGCARPARRRPRGSATGPPPRRGPSTNRWPSAPAAPTTRSRRRPARRGRLAGHLDEQPALRRGAARAPRCPWPAPGRRSGRPAPRRRPAGPAPAASSAGTASAASAIDG